MKDATDRIIAQLEADWPHWEVWVVRRVVGGPVWCARRRDDHKRVLNAYSVEQLEGYLEDEAGPPGVPAQRIPKDPPGTHRFPRDVS